MSKSIVSTALSNVQLEPGSIPREWLLSGNPETRSKLLVRSHDWISDVVVWECGAVCYKWHYDQDEAYLVLSGEGFMTDDKGVERRFGPGDVAYFPPELTLRGVILITLGKSRSSKNPFLVPLVLASRHGTSFFAWLA